MLQPDRALSVCGVFAHPDDETLAVGGLLQIVRPSDIVIVTDGAPPWVDDPDHLIRIRQREAHDALEWCGVSHRLHWIGLGDQCVAAQFSELVTKLAFLIESHQTLLTHALEGGHPDHDAVCLAVHAAARLCQHSGPVFECPLYHSEQGALTFSQSDIRGPTLDEKQIQIKRAMMACYRSQRDFISRFPVGTEIYRPVSLREQGSIPDRSPTYPDMIPSSMTPALWTSLRDRFEAMAL